MHTKTLSPPPPACLHRRLRRPQAALTARPHPHLCQDVFFFFFSAGKTGHLVCCILVCSGRKQHAQRHQMCCVAVEK